MEFYYDVQYKKFGSINEGREVLRCGMESLFQESINKLKDNHFRATEFIAVKNRYPGCHIRHSKRIYHNIEDFGFLLGNRIVMYYEEPFIKSTSIYNPNEIINYKKWQKYFKENENPEVAAKYLLNRKAELAYNMSNYSYKDDLILLSDSVKLWLELNGVIDELKE